MWCVEALVTQYKIISVVKMCLQAYNKLQNVAILGVFTTTLCSRKQCNLIRMYVPNKVVTR